MKAREWQRYLETQRRSHHKTVYTVTELANVSRSSPHALNVELDRLCKQGMIVRLARGKYGLPEAVSPEALLPYLDAHAYLTGAYALHRHNLITQLPVEITCFTNRRHNRSRVRQTPVGRFTFICVQPPVYALPLEGHLAGLEQALCDYVFVMRRRGVAPESQVTLRGLESLAAPTLQEIASRYPKTVRQTIGCILGRPLNGLST
jgi:hypothetical protein